MDRQLQIVLKLQDQASKELQKVIGPLDQAQKSTTMLGIGLDDVAAMAKKAAIGLGAVAVAGATYGVTIAAQLETAQVGISTLLGSTEKGAATMARIKKEAARTPFELPGLTQAVQLLASVTHDGDKAVNIIMDVGEGLAAMGKGQAELDRVIINLQQIAALGHAATIDIKQFAFAGIPIFEMLQQETGLAGEALSKFIEDGGVTFDLLTKMFDKANDEGGRFFNAFQNQSGTFNQALSNMKDAIGIFLADVVTSTGLFHLLTAAMIEASSWLGNYKQNLADMGATLSQFIDQLNAQTGIITVFRLSWEQIAAAWTNDLQPALALLMEALQPLMPYIDALAKSIGVALVSAIVAAVNALANFVDLVGITLTFLIRFVAYVSEKLAPAIHFIGVEVDWVVSRVNALIEAFGKLTGVKASAMNGFNVGGMLKTAIGAAGLPLIPFASGGIVTGPTPALVGEAGPEAIIPLSQMGRLGGITVNVYGDVTGTELIERVKEGLMDALGANSRFAI